MTQATKKPWLKPEIRVLKAGAAEAGCSGKAGTLADTTCKTKS